MALKQLFISVTCLYTHAVGHMGTGNSLKRPLQNSIAPFFNAEMTWEDSITPIVIRDLEMQKRQCKDLIVSIVTRHLEMLKSPQEILNYLTGL